MTRYACMYQVKTVRLPLQRRCQSSIRHRRKQSQGSSFIASTSLLISQTPMSSSFFSVLHVTCSKECFSTLALVTSDVSLMFKLFAWHVGEDLCLALPALHAFTWCDTTSAFVRKGKMRPLKLLKKDSEF